jgi:hypothetical protein
MFKHYYGYIKFQRFFGVKAGRSVWNDAFIRTRYTSSGDCVVWNIPLGNSGGLYWRYQPLGYFNLPYSGDSHGEPFALVLAVLYGNFLGAKE